MYKFSNLFQIVTVDFSFEAIFLALYISKTKSRNDKPLVITIPNPNPQTLNLPRAPQQTTKPIPNPHHIDIY